MPNQRDNQGRKTERRPPGVPERRLEDAQPLASRYQLFIEDAPAAIAMFDRDMRYLAASGRYLKEYRLSGDLTGRTHYEVFPDIPERWKAVHARCLAGASEQCEADSFTRADGSVEWLRWEMRPWYDADGRVGGLLLFSENITERKRIEQALRERSDELQQVLATAAIGITRLDRDLRYLLANQAYARLAGVPLETIIGHTMEEVLGAAALEKVRPHIARVLQGESVEYEAELPWAAAGRRWIHAIYTPWREPDGSISGWLASITDITERKHAEQALRESEERYRRLFLNMAEEVHYWQLVRDEAGQIRTWRLVDANPAALKSWGKRLEEVQGKLADESFPGATEHFMPVVQKIMAEGAPVSFESYFPALKQHLRLTSVPLGDHFITTGADITSFKEAQEALQESEARLRESQEGLLSLTESIPQLVWRCDAEGRCDYLSRQWLRYTGQSRAEALGYGWAAAIHEEDRERLLGQWRDSVAKGTAYDTETRIRAADGSYRWFKQRAVPMPDAHGVGRWFGTSTDISDMIAAREALQEADRRKDVFLATLAHELRNPLAPIRSAAELLGVSRASAEQLAWAQAIIRRQVTHMALLLDDLLDVSRITQGKLILKLEPVELASVVDSAIEAARPLIDRKQHQLRVSLPAETPPLIADPLRLSQVISNLLTNAAKYTDPGGHIELRAYTEGATFLLEVCDDGLGIPAEALPHLFTMFSQVHADKDRAEGGLGIGLAIVKGLLELHEGSVSVSSAGPGHGTTFTIRLPLRGSPSAARDRNKAEPIPAKGHRVMVVDDNRDAADALGLILQLSGHEVRVAYDGRSALALAQGFRPAAVLLDIGMPRMDGYALARALRAEPWGREMLLVALTGWGQDEDRAQADEAGFDAHLAKPGDPKRIEALLAGIPRR
ncbi:MAG: PAS domain-containing protein [Gammaproteobacteria bacterium]|nr:PAS domain-containing protein [Gammaproteobacteria bacterium]